MPTKKISRQQAKRPTIRKRIAKTFVNIILDESGSMWGLSKATVTGVNTYLTGLKGTKNVMVTLTKFNTGTNVLYALTPLTRAKPLTELNYLPAGGTALYDAIGTCVKAVSMEVKKGDRVLTLIVTDGQENSSRSYSKADVKTLITSLEAQGNWTFTFLGANLDVAKEADAIGINRGNSWTYQPTQVGTQSAFNKMSADTVSYLAATSGPAASLSVQNFYQAAQPEETKVYSGKPRKRIIP